jgi:NADPH:quinone reductase-like Zn-dependent oxidoreductase
LKAVVWTRYGPPDVLEEKEVGTPAIKAHDILIKVRAASINSWDLDLLVGKGRITLGGRLRPPFPVLGCDVAGTVEATGSKVTRFHAGDEVFGDLCRDGWGGFAEFARAKETSLAIKPSHLSFEQAAAIPQAGGLALQGLRRGNVHEGQRILMNGAGGGVGTFAIQMAKAHSAEVTGVDRAGKLDLIRSLGAAQALDFQEQDFTRLGEEYDLILDVACHRSVSDYKRALTANGLCLIIGGKGSTAMRDALLGSFAFGGRKVKLMLYRPDPSGITDIAEMIAAKNVAPVIDRTYHLHDLADAFRYCAEGNVKGKVVVTVP